MGAGLMILVVGLDCLLSYLTSANVEGRSTMRAPPKRGVDVYVVMFGEGILELYAKVVLMVWIDSDMDVGVGRGVQGETSVVGDSLDEEPIIEDNRENVQYFIPTVLTILTIPKTSLPYSSPKNPPP